MTWKRILAVVVVALSAGAGRADDIPFGADTLSQLVENAEIIIVAREARALPHDAALADDPDRVAMHAYTVRATEVIDGAVVTGSELRIGVVGASDPPRVDEIDGAILFLQLMSPAEVATSTMASGSPAYAVVSGEYGIVDGAVSGRKEAVRSYVEATRGRTLRSDEILQLARRHLTSADLFLQRSGIIDLHLANEEAGAVQVLGEALMSSRVADEMKTSVIAALEDADMPAATAHLRAFAENQAVQRGLRQAAIKAFRSLPGGDEQLRQWSTTADPLLAPAARSALQSMGGKQP